MLRGTGKDRRLDARNADDDDTEFFFSVVDIAIPQTHRPARRGRGRGPGRRERACRGRGSQHASARLHLWGGRGGRGGMNSQGEKKKKASEEGERFPAVGRPFFFLFVARP